MIPPPFPTFGQLLGHWGSSLVHITRVWVCALRFTVRLWRQLLVHDWSKFGPTETRYFASANAKLSRTAYGSPEYMANLQRLGPAILHHYRANRHHPNYWVHGISDMSLVDLVEYHCDCQAASHRNKDGDIVRSIAQNHIRFGLSSQLTSILLFTALDSEVLPGLRSARAADILGQLDTELVRRRGEALQHVYEELKNAS